MAPRQRTGDGRQARGSRRNAGASSDSASRLNRALAPLDLSDDDLTPVAGEAGSAANSPAPRSLADVVEQAARNLPGAPVVPAPPRVGSSPSPTFLRAAA
jgi:hypothetical protein